MSALPATGTAMPPLVRRLDSARLVAYAGATWDWHKLHHDSAYAAGRGLDAPVVDGQLFGALLAEAVQDWLGPGFAVARLGFRFRALVPVGSTVRCEGEIAESDGERGRCELRVLVEGSGEVAVAPAWAEIRTRRQERGG